MLIGVVDKDGRTVSFSGPGECLLGCLLADFEDDERFTIEGELDEWDIEGIRWYEDQYENLIRKEYDRTIVLDALFWVFDVYGINPDSLRNITLCAVYCCVPDPDPDSEAEDFVRSGLLSRYSVSELFEMLGRMAESCIDYDWLQDWCRNNDYDDASVWAREDPVGFMVYAEERGWPVDCFVDFTTLWEFQKGCDGMHRVDDCIWIELY